MCKLNLPNNFSLFSKSLLIALFYMFVGCSSEDEEDLQTEMPELKIEASIYSDKIESRYSGSSIKALSFSQDDSICVFMDGKKLCKWSLKNNKWNPSSNSIWADTINSHKFDSFYPYNENCTYDSVFSASLVTQNGTFANLNKYDLLIASKSTDYKVSKGIVSFTGENGFKHALSLIRINIVGSGEFANATINTIKLSSPRLFSTLIYSFEDNKSQIDTSTDLNELTISPNHQMNGVSKEFFIITTPKSTESEIKFTINYSTPLATNVEKVSSLSDHYLKTGFIYQYNIHLKDGNIDIEEPQITSWEEGNIIEDIYL